MSKEYQRFNELSKKSGIHNFYIPLHVQIANKEKQMKAASRIKTILENDDIIGQMLH